ncbi:MAG: hypothetical protein DF168_02056 [Candidatus Moanabacter tarae]|uniref:LysM domain-containing protein n=1 Tax=Candidatus Moanibacter tarae TaxID=2200854 RepID=A0A2Z4ARU1_9BACT|nr:MAG: hypothetical protein DF168_02056 [Candidatus Moanabacter tarae]|tara:strand:+ start:31758 stop:32375 length:618 start_codon:yes stop_codon:yes gene_type:complete
MDDFDDALLPEERKGISTVGPFITNALLVLGLCVGLVALYFALQVRSEMFSVQNELKARPAQTVALKADLDSLESRLVKVGAETVRIKNQVHAVRDQNHQAYDELRRGVKGNRKWIDEFDKQVAGIRGQAVEEPVVATGVAITKIDAGVETRLEESNAGYHVVQRGDNFGRLANQYNTTVDAFLKANPGVDPRRLQIGQRLKIPN